MDATSPIPETGAKRAWTVIAAWIGGISAVLGLVGALTGSFNNLTDHFRSHAERDSRMAIAQSQARQGDYAAAVQSYADILKTDALYKPALDQELQTTLLWVEDFHAIASPGQDPGPSIATQLDQILALLDAGLVRAVGIPAADIQAHLGWAHWLNQHIAEREFGPAAEKNLRAALVADPNNVYANAMLGNWMLQNGGNFSEAIAHFNTAVATGKQRPLVRTMQLGALIDYDVPGARAEVVRAANAMRKGAEPIDERSRTRALTFCYGVELGHEELLESLSAVPPAEAMPTYLWLDSKPREGNDAQYQLLLRDYIAANLLEMSGDRAAALTKFEDIQHALRNQGRTLEDPVKEAIGRLSHK